MKIPSLFSLWHNTLAIIKRFPLQFLFVLMATITACWLVELDYHARLLNDNLVKLLAICNIGLAASLAGDLYCETHGVNATKKYVLRAIIIMGCAAVFFLLQPQQYEADVYKLVLLAIACHLLVSFAPFLTQGLINGFWQFNKTLFLRFVTGVLYTLVLYAGLAIALFAMNKLFALDLRTAYYQHLFLLLGIGFNTLFFLGGIPPNLILLEQQNDYPKGLKIFTQYVLIPLMSIYLLILLVYEIKIIFDWELPKGLVSNLIIGYAFFGILSLLLIYPISNTAGNKWITLFSKGFYLMMIPLLILLLLAIYKRIGSYGFTEFRYFLVALSVWLTLITLYFLYSKAQNIKFIPISLCAITVLAIYGPQSASYITRSSQTKRLKTLITKTDAISAQEKASIVRYLVGHYGLSSLHAFTDINLDSLEKSFNDKRPTASSYSISEEKIDTAYILLTIDPKLADPNSRNYSVGIPNPRLIPVKDWEYMVAIDNYQQDVQTRIGTDSLSVNINSERRSYSIKIGDDQHLFKLDSLIAHIEKAHNQHTLVTNQDLGNNFYYPAEEMEFTAQVGKYLIKLTIIELYINHYNPDNLYINAKANILLKKKE